MPMVQYQLAALKFNGLIFSAKEGCVDTGGNYGTDN